MLVVLIALCIIDIILLWANILLISSDSFSVKDPRAYMLFTIGLFAGIIHGLLVCIVLASLGYIADSNIGFNLIESGYLNYNVTLTLLLLCLSSGYSFTLLLVYLNSSKSKLRLNSIVKLIFTDVGATCASIGVIFSVIWFLIMILAIIVMVV